MVDATRVRASGATGAPWGDSDIGALAEALALAAVCAGVRAAGTGRGAAAGLAAGVPATSAASPFTARVLILRGSSPAKVPLAAGAAKPAL